MMTLGSKIYAAPLKEHPNLQRILDAGTGTGVWAMDMGKLLKHKQHLPHTTIY